MTLKEKIGGLFALLGIITGLFMVVAGPFAVVQSSPVIRVAACTDAAYQRAVENGWKPCLHYIHNFTGGYVPGLVALLVGGVILIVVGGWGLAGIGVNGKGR